MADKFAKISHNMKGRSLFLALWVEHFVEEVSTIFSSCNFPL